MLLRVVTMDRDSADEIRSWRYPPPYDFYDLADTKETMTELLCGAYFKVIDADDALVGFCCSGDCAKVPVGTQYGAYPSDGSLDVGFGMRPDKTGMGLGTTFMHVILRFYKQEVHPERFRLTVARFNQRAIRLYEKLGFKFVLAFPNGNVEFQTMYRPVADIWHRD